MYIHVYNKIVLENVSILVFKTFPPFIILKFFPFTYNRPPSHCQLEATSCKELQLAQTPSVNLSMLSRSTNNGTNL